MKHKPSVSKDRKKVTEPTVDGKWVFCSSMDEAIDHFERVLDKVRENTARARVNQPKRRPKSG